jgi:hypothetical protein
VGLLPCHHVETSTSPSGEIASNRYPACDAFTVSKAIKVSTNANYKGNITPYNLYFDMNFQFWNACPKKCKKNGPLPVENLSERPPVGPGAMS